MVRVLTGMTLAAALLAGCAQSTPYQAVGTDGGSRYGYEEQRIERNRFLVSFAGNSLTDRETVETFLLYRAAELTLQEGFDHFTVVRRDTDSQTRVTGRQPDPFDRFHIRYRYFHPVYGWYGWRDPFWNDVDLREVTRYDASAEIILGRGAAPADVDAFDARDVLANLGPRVTRPAEG